MIAIIQYGLGNVSAFANIYSRLNIEAKIVTEPSELNRADRIILPGVGAFDWAMKRLIDSGMKEAIDVAVKEERKPVLGVCVGMQIMARRSDEGVKTGLGWIDAEVKKFGTVELDHPLHLPHMGWNDVQPIREHGLFKGLEQSAQFYFLHSYYFSPTSKENVLAVTDYHGRYASSVVLEPNVFGVQFHPEKSHSWGMQLLKNFSEL